MRYEVESPVRKWESWAVWDDYNAIILAKFDQKCPNAEARARKLCDELNGVQELSHSTARTGTIVRINDKAHARWVGQTGVITNRSEDNGWVEVRLEGEETSRCFRASSLTPAELNAAEEESK